MPELADGRVVEVKALVQPHLGHVLAASEVLKAVRHEYGTIGIHLLQAPIAGTTLVLWQAVVVHLETCGPSPARLCPTLEQPLRTGAVRSHLLDSVVVDAGKRSSHA